MRASFLLQSEEPLEMKTFFANSISLLEIIEMKI